MYSIITDIQLFFSPIAYEGTVIRYVQHCQAILERKVLYMSLLTLSFITIFSSYGDLGRGTVNTRFNNLDTCWGRNSNNRLFGRRTLYQLCYRCG